MRIVGLFIDGNDKECLQLYSLEILHTLESNDHILVTDTLISCVIE